MLYRLLTSTLLLLSGLVSTSLEQEHQGVLYTKPKDWVEWNEGAAKVFSPSDLKSGEVVAVLLTPAVPVSEDTLAKQFDQSVASANEGSTVLAKGDVENKAAQGASIYLQVMELETPEIGKSSRIYAMIVAGKQKTFLVSIFSKDSLVEKHGKAVMELVGSLKFKSVPTTTPTKVEKANTPITKIPIGNTPDLFPGSTGWLPSGKGVEIPKADIVNGKPQGLWWKPQVGTNGILMPITHIYLPNGVRASNPRPGGGNLFDIEGQRNQKGHTGVGTFTIDNGQLVEKYDGFENKGAFKFGTDKDGKFFKIGGAIFRPLIPLNKQNIVGNWRGTNSEIRFKADGTYEMGQILRTDDWVAGSNTTGTYVIEGYLLMMVPKDGPILLSRSGIGGLMLVRGSVFYHRR